MIGVILRHWFWSQTRFCHITFNSFVGKYFIWCCFIVFSRQLTTDTYKFSSLLCKLFNISDVKHIKWNVSDVKTYRNTHLYKQLITIVFLGIWTIFMAIHLTLSQNHKHIIHFIKYYIVIINVVLADSSTVLHSDTKACAIVFQFRIHLMLLRNNIWNCLTSKYLLWKKK